MVNTLANHGYLPRDGLNVSLDILVQAFSDAVNLDESATLLVGDKALDTSTTGNNSTFNLDDLDTHDSMFPLIQCPGPVLISWSISVSVPLTHHETVVLEHDGSLSRNDIYFGDNHSFNETIWNSVAAYFTEDTIDVATAAKARKARLEVAEAVNPEYELSAELTVFSLIESSLYLSVFSNGTSGSAVTEWVDVMFRESLPPPPPPTHHCSVYRCPGSEHLRES